MFFGYNMLGDGASSNNIIEANQDFDSLWLTNTYIDHLYGVSNDTLNRPSWNQSYPEGQNYGTAFNADFNATLQGGNITYSGASISKIKIKRKLPNEDNQKTIWVKEPDDPQVGLTSEDFNLIDENGNPLIDFLEPNDTEVQYMYVPVFKVGTEAGTSELDVNSFAVSTTSHFDADMIVGRGSNGLMNGFPARFNESLNTQRNRQTSLVQTMGSKYPYAILNGLSDYYSGSMQAWFILMDEDCHLNTIGATEYKRQLDDFLANGSAKIIKTYDGEMYMIMLDNTITHDDNGVYIGNETWVEKTKDDDIKYVPETFRFVTTNFNWNEIGSAYSINDLYENDFINTNLDAEAVEI